MKKNVLITGASSGIGKACAELFAAEGYSLIITARRHDLIEQFAAELRTKYQVDVLPVQLDVRKRLDVNRFIDEIPEAFSHIHILVNNAGLALGASPLHQGDPDDWETMIDTNIKGLLYVSRAVANSMILNGIEGRIIHIGSIAGKEVYGNGNVYCATKAAVNSLTRSMRIDLLPHGIKVSQVAPGAVETNFSNVRYKGDVELAKNVYKGFTPLIAADIARVVHFVATQPDHVNIDDVLVTPSAQASASVFNRK